MQKLVILDGHAIIHRAYHAIRPLHTKEGEQVNAVYGFASMLLNVLEIENPDYLAVAFDKKGPTFRHLADKNYKATRSKTDDELVAQIRRVYEIVRAFSVPIFALAGMEADDMIGSICCRVAEKNDLQTIIVSGDRDLLQLVNERVSLHDLTGGYRKSINFTPEKVLEKYGFGPEKIPDFKGLSGDSSDNIPGVTGIGPKTATDLILQFGSVEGIYERLDEVQSAKTREKLDRDREQAFHSKKMATIHCGAPMDFELENCRLHDFDRETVVKLFTELNFQSLQVRLDRLFPTDEMVAAETGGTQQSLF